MSPLNLTKYGKGKLAEKLLNEGLELLFSENRKKQQGGFGALQVITV